MLFMGFVVHLFVHTRLHSESERLRIIAQPEHFAKSVRWRCVDGWWGQDKIICLTIELY